MDNVLFLFFEPNGLVAFQSLPISPPLILQWLRRRHFIGALQCHGERLKYDSEEISNAWFSKLPSSRRTPAYVDASEPDPAVAVRLSLGFIQKYGDLAVRAKRE